MIILVWSIFLYRKVFEAHFKENVAENPILGYIWRSESSCSHASLKFYRDTYRYCSKLGRISFSLDAIPLRYMIVSSTFAEALIFLERNSLYYIWNWKRNNLRFESGNSIE